MQHVTHDCILDWKKEKNKSRQDIFQQLEKLESGLYIK